MGLQCQGHLKGFRTAILAITLLSGCYLGTSQEQVGKPFITNYSYQEYEGSPVNWWELEDEKGVMYFANGIGVLQYDGVNWKVIPMNDSARCLVQDDMGTIYVGGIGEFGFLQPDDKGNLTFTSLVDKIPEEHKEFRDVWEVDYYQGRVIFRTEFKLYCWDGEKIKVIESSEGYHVGNIVNGTYYLRIWGRGLCYLKEDDTFALVPNGERFADERIYVILPYDKETVLIGTRNEGFYLFDGENFTPFKTGVDDYVKGKLYLPGVALEDGRFAFNTFSDGTYLTDHDGNLMHTPRKTGCRMVA